MAVNVNDLHAAFADGYFSAFRRNGLKRQRRPRNTFQKIPATGHGLFSFC
jgi:hypothetical protein